mmetsp:Transcript_26620/g.76740  ORF Transcript_26620/g.76740 Transcript_26620/m.76740 type:complete len:389 (+) Transcript_26620:244-1410(+)
MLRPPPGPEFHVHNFERILIQQKEDIAFFMADPDLEKLVDRGFAGIGALVGRLEAKYSDYLNSTWKNGAMKKVLQKLEDKEFELSMLGVVTENSQKDRLVREEVERRLGPDSPVQGLYNSFVARVVRQQFCQDVRAKLAYLNGVSWDGHDIDDELRKVKSFIEDAVSKVLAQVQSWWIERLHDILTAESKLDENMGASEINIVTSGLKGISLRMFGKGKPKRRVQEEIKQRPLVQLSQYKQFTDDIMLKCRQLFEDATETLAKDTEALSERCVDPDSPWLKLQLLPSEVQPVDGHAVCSTKVAPQFEIESFLTVLITQFLRRIPSPRMLQRVHHGVAVGAEKEAALAQYNHLKAEIRTIEAARNGIRRALTISDDEFAALQQGLDADS